MRSSQAKLLLAVLAVLQFSAVSGYLLFTASQVALANSPWISQILTISQSLVLGAFAFYFGSSQGSARKDEIIAASSPVAPIATAVPSTTTTESTSTTKTTPTPIPVPQPPEPKP